MDLHIRSQTGQRAGAGKGDPTLPFGSYHMFPWNGFDPIRGRRPSDKSGHDRIKSVVAFLARPLRVNRASPARFLWR